MICFYIAIYIVVAFAFYTVVMPYVINHVINDVDEETGKKIDRYRKGNMMICSVLWPICIFQFIVMCIEVFFEGLFETNGEEPED